MLARPTPSSLPYQLDARRCISYWTIEHKGSIAKEFADELHGWVFGCDVCQDVCPWNRKPPTGRLEELQGRHEWSNPDLIEWLDRDALTWSARAGEGPHCIAPGGLVWFAMRPWCWGSGVSRQPCRWLEGLPTQSKTPWYEPRRPGHWDELPAARAIEALRQICESTDHTVCDAITAGALQAQRWRARPGSMV